MIQHICRAAPRRFWCGEASLLGMGRRGALSAVNYAVLIDILAFASRVAAITCGRQGANPPTLAELVPR